MPSCGLSADAAEIPIFDFSKFKDEDAAAQELTKYHEEQLRACGLPMSRRNGYTVHDLHKQELYSVQIGQQRCTGGVAAGVLPYAVRPGSAAKLLRIGFLHKQSTDDKAAFLLNNPDPEQVEAPCHSPMNLPLDASLVFDSVPACTAC